jgi:hypothetical protein
VYFSHRSPLRLRMCLGPPGPSVCVCVTTHPRSQPHRIICSQLYGGKAAAVLPQPATRNVCSRCTCASSTAPRNYPWTYSPATLPRQSSLPTVHCRDHRSARATVPPPPLCRSRECPSAFLYFPVNKMCTYSNTKLSGTLIRERRPWISCGTGWETGMSLRLCERSGYRQAARQE